jgi:CRISPR-associated protein Cmr3
MSVTWLSVRPLDTMMVRDGRSFTAGSSARARPVAPHPSTLGGVVRAVLGQDADRLVGPVAQVGGRPVFPVPADVVRDGKLVRRLAVRERDPRESSDLDQRYRLTHGLVGEGQSIGDRWITGEGMAAWLTGAAPPVGTDIPEKDMNQLVGAPWVSENRVGLARRWDGEFAGTAAPKFLYSADHLRMRDDAALIMGYRHDGRLPIVRSVVPLGGRGRVVSVTDQDVADPFPPMPTSFPDGRVAVYLATPALVADVLWTPPQPGVRLCALALGGAQTVATASPRQGVHTTSRLLWAVPAGSVFYLKFDGEDSAVAEAGALSWARTHHGDLLPGLSREVMPIVTAGFGTCLTGSW